MMKKCLVWIAFVSLSGSALADPVTRVGPMPIAADTSVSVTTSRSDGAVFPAVSQTKRQQRSRQVRISSSTQALTNRTRFSASEEAASGGVFVAASSGRSRIEDAGPAPIIAVPLVNVPARAAPIRRPHQSKR